MLALAYPLPLPCPLPLVLVLGCPRVSRRMFMSDSPSVPRIKTNVQCMFDMTELTISVLLGLLLPASLAKILTHVPMIAQ